jgi:uncharacterized protein YndB with AHSA1/START domain
VSTGEKESGVPLAILSTDLSSLTLRDEFPSASPDALFGYWTVPALLCSWWPPLAEVEPLVGGSYAFSWPEAGWRLVGRYTAFEPGQRLGFTWRWLHEPDAPETEVALAFNAMEGGGTRLTLTHGPYDETPGSREMRAGHLEGWTHFLGTLHEVIADEGAG